MGHSVVGGTMLTLRKLWLAEKELNPSGGEMEDKQ